MDMATVTSARDVSSSSDNKKHTVEGIRHCSEKTPHNKAMNRSGISRFSRRKSISRPVIAGRYADQIPFHPSCNAVAAVTVDSRDITRNSVGVSHCADAM